MKTAAYYRRSTNIQENSLEMQKDRALHTAIKRGILVDLEFTDDAISARKTNVQDRKQLDSLLDLIRQDQVTTLLVYKRDRLARKAIQYLEMYRLFKSKNVQVIFTSDSEIPIMYSPVGEMIESVMAGLIEHEGELIVERIKSAVQSNFRNGKYPGTLPFGYRFNSETKEIIRDEAALDFVSDLYSKCENGELLKSLAEYARNIYPDRNWTPAGIKKLLQNPTYCGIRMLNIKGAEPLVQEYSQLSIIEGQRWEKVCDLLESQSKSPNRTRAERRTGPLDGIIRCTRCNAHLVLKLRRRKGDTDPAYQCPNCRNIAIRQDEVEDIVMDNTVDFLRRLIRSNYSDLVQQKLKRSRERLQERLDRAQQQYDKVERKVFHRVEHWAFTQISESERGRLENQFLSLGEQVQRLASEKERLEVEFTQLESIPEQMERLKQCLLESDPRKYLHEPQTFRTIIQTVDIDGCFVDVTFKHPFGGMREAYSYDLSS